MSRPLSLVKMIIFEKEPFLYLLVSKVTQAADSKIELKYHIIDKPGCWKTMFWVHTIVCMIWVHIQSSIKVIQII